MKQKKPAYTATHFAAASFAAAFFSVIAVLAVIGGTVKGESQEAAAQPASTESNVWGAAAETDAPALVDEAGTDNASASTEIVVAEQPAVKESDDSEYEPRADAFRYSERPMRRGPDRQFGPPSFDDIDKDGDGNITRSEFDDFHAANRGPGPRGLERRPRGGFDGPPRGPQGGPGEFRGGPGGPRSECGPGGFGGPPRGPQGGPGEFRGGRGGPRGGHGPDGFGGPPHGPQGGPGEFRGGRGGPRGGHGPGGFEGPPPQFRDDEGRRGPRADDRGDFDRRPPRPEFSDLDANGDGSISEQEFNDFRPPREPRNGRDEFPREESF